jgi:TPP-dependent pyruvate/acetoin dehydrogenase alpha subunit
MMIKNLVDELPIVNEPLWDKTGLIQFERKMADHWESGRVRGPIHLSGGNEDELIEIFKYIKKSDWVFSTWRSHYHALLKGVPSEWLEEEILAGRSITIINQEEKFYASAIVGAIIPIATGVALSNKRNNTNDKVWCFVGDMAFETGGFYEMHKYAQRYNLPIRFVVEDNGVSTNTPTEETWNGIKRDVPNDVIWYNYKKEWPHYGTGKWVIF